MVDKERKNITKKGDGLLTQYWVYTEGDSGFNPIGGNVRLCAS